MEKSNLRLVEIEQQPYGSGIRRIKAKYERPDGSIFWAFAVIGDAKENALITGTANGGYGIDDCVDVVPGQMQTALEEGHTVLAGMNAGYFRRKFHFRPYGLSIRNGIEISPPHSEPTVAVSGGIELGTLWIGIDGDRQLIFGSEETYPEYRGKLMYAASPSHYLVKEGRISMVYEDVTLEPRSAFGVTAAGEYVLLVIDGRQPGYSSGASNRETATVLCDLGVETGVNFDGGGSTNLSVCEDGRITTFNQPCEDRRVFDTLMLVKK